jgi:hypothetical protein
MAYIGPEPRLGQNREVDDISSGFNGNTATFNLQVNGLAVSPGSANAILVSLGGVIQNPGTDYTVSTSTITFTTNPASGLSFFGLVLGQGIDTQTIADGQSPTMAAPVITGDLSIADKIVHTGDTNNAIRFPAADTITAETAGSERVRVDSSGNVGIGKTSPNIGSHTRVLTVSNTGTSARAGVEIEGNTANAHGVLEFYNNGTLVSGLNSRGSDRLQFVTGSSGTVRGQFTSNGLNFGSDNTAATALNEYEEGTWTPAISGVTYSDAQGHYVKIGTTCFVTLTLNGANTSAGGADTRITGLPFTPKVDGGEFYPANSIPLFEVSSISLASGFNNMYLRIDDSQGNLQIMVTDGESHNILTAGGGTTLNSNHALRTSFTYLTNA